MSEREVWLCWNDGDYYGPDPLDCGDDWIFATKEGAQRRCERYDKANGYRAKCWRSSKWRGGDGISIFELVGTDLYIEREQVGE